MDGKAQQHDRTYNDHEAKRSPHVIRALRCTISSPQPFIVGGEIASLTFCTRHTRSLSGQLLSGRVGMWQALIAEFAHPHLVDRLIWPSPLGTRLANASTDRFFQCEFHRDYSLAGDAKSEGATAPGSCPLPEAHGLFGQYPTRSLTMAFIHIHIPCICAACAALLSCRARPFFILHK